MTFWRELWHQLGTSTPQAVGVVIASCVLYLTFTAVLRLWGQRFFANRSGTGLAVVLVLGSIVGRSMLGPGPTLLGGLICLATLIALETFFGTGRRAGLIGHRRPVVLYREGMFDRGVLRRYHLNESMVWARMRQAGVSSPDQVLAVVLETDGSLSLLRTGAPPHPSLLAGVRGADQVSPE